mmetsp:Transcript_14962/g.28957  ORF Transcript_14962/g.28957 Transcript_14962/m.28957 type:complete len:237 (-) Transcript_14962:144-854(-)
MLSSAVLDSSRVITPALPTFAMASEMSLPTSSFPPAETVATLARSWSLTSVEMPLSSWTSLVTVLSMPLVTCTGFAPAITIFIPSAIMAAERMVAVVVPSPATSLVLEAAWRTSFAPIFSTGSSRSTSFATVTPSFTIFGDPNFVSSTTFLPLGPSVTPTTLASFSTPFCIFLIASPSTLKWSCFAFALTCTGPRVRDLTLCACTTLLVPAPLVLELNILLFAAIVKLGRPVKSIK